MHPAACAHTSASLFRARCRSSYSAIRRQLPAAVLDGRDGSEPVQLRSRSILLPMVPIRASPTGPRPFQAAEEERGRRVSMLRARATAIPKLAGFAELGSPRSSMIGVMKTPNAAANGRPSGDPATGTQARFCGVDASAGACAAHAITRGRGGESGSPQGRPAVRRTYRDDHGGGVDAMDPCVRGRAPGSHDDGELVRRGSVGLS